MYGKKNGISVSLKTCSVRIIKKICEKKNPIFETASQIHISYQLVVVVASTSTSS